MAGEKGRVAVAVGEKRRLRGGLPERRGVHGAIVQDAEPEHFGERKGVVRLRLPHRVEPREEEHVDVERRATLLKVEPTRRYRRRLIVGDEAAQPLVPQRGGRREPVGGSKDKEVLEEGDGEG